MFLLHVLLKLYIGYGIQNNFHFTFLLITFKETLSESCASKCSIPISCSSMQSSAV